MQQQLLFPLASLPRPRSAASIFPPPSSAATGTRWRHLPASVASVSQVSSAPTGVSVWRETAVAQIKRSSDLDADLSSLREILQIQDLNIILQYFGELKRWSEVSQVFDWMTRNGLINYASHSSFIKYMGKSRNPVKALAVYNDITDASYRNNASICNSILGCLLRNGKFDGGMKLFDQMKRDGLKPDLVTYSTLLASCSKVKNGYSVAMQLVQELQAYGLYMDSVIYGSLLAICASNKLLDEAELFFQQMKAEGLSPNLFHYSSLLNTYSANGDHVKADKLMDDMKVGGLVPNKVILTTLLKVYARGGLLQKSRDLLSELETLGYAEEEMPYCILMDSLVKAGQINEAKVIFHDMKAKSVKSDGYCYSIMISAFCRSGLLTEAKQLAMEFESRYEKYDLVMLNTLLRAYCNNGDMENVMLLLKKIDNLSISPDWNTYQILIKYFCREKLHHLAYRTLEDMHKKGHQLEEEVCCSLIYQLARSGASSEAFSIYNMLKYSKRTIPKSLHERILNILVHARLFKDAYVVMKDNAKHISETALKKFAVSFMKSGNMNMINDVVKAFHRCSHEINQEILHLAVARYVAKPEKEELLVQLLQWMVRHNYIVDMPTKKLLKNSPLFGPKYSMGELFLKQHSLSRKTKNCLRKK